MALEPVSVVIPSWNGAAILRPTLEKLAQLEGINFEVLVVDHGRLNRDTENLFKEYAADSRFVYVGLDEQLGYAGAVNYGTEKAKHRLIAVLCNDVIVEKDWLAELSKAHGAAQAQGIKPVLTSLVTRPGFDHALSARYNIWGRIVETGEGAGAYIPFFPDGSAFLFDKSRYGLPFDSEYFLYQEDVSIGWRAWLMGESVAMVQSSRALNADGGTTRRTPYRTAYFTERNRWLNYFKYLSLRSLVLLMPVLLADAFLKLLVGSNRLAKLQAWGWLLVHPLKILEKRSEAQKLRRRSDAEILPLISGKYVGGGGGVNAFFLAYFKVARLRLS